MQPPPQYANLPFPWHKVEEADRGHDTPCWWWQGSYSGYFLRRSRSLWIAVIGDHPRRSEGRSFNHLCEVHGERNLCVRPDHVVIGNWSTNGKLHHALRREAGVPHWSDEGRERVRAAAARERSAEHRAALSASASERYERLRDERVTCPECGKPYHPLWIGRHRRAVHDR